MSAATRTQVYLTAEQRRKIDLRSAQDGTTLAEVVRRALDRYLDETSPAPDVALDATFGAIPTLEVPSRDEWDRG